MISFAERRPVTWLVLLVGFNLILLSIQARNDQGQVLIRGWALAVVTPVVYVLTGTTSWIGNSVGTFFRLYRTEKENESLRRQIATLQIESHRLKGLSSIWLRSRDLSRLREGFDFDTVSARVIGRSAPFFQERILINAGLRDDVRRDSAILHANGIIGRVLSSNLLSAEVEVITNAGAAVGGIVEGSRLQGVVKGDGSELLTLDFVPNSDEVSIGATILTSGWDRIYPAGLPIGEVIRSVRGPMVYREIQLRPFVDLSRIEEVLAVRRTGDLEFLRELDSLQPQEPEG